MRPRYVVLDTRDAIMAFDAFLKTMPQYQYNTEECVRGMFWRMDSQSNAPSNIDAFIHDLTDELNGQRPYDHVYGLCVELDRVAKAIWEELQRCHVYDESGINCYFIHQFLGFDLVLELNEVWTYDLSGPNAPYQ